MSMINVDKLWFRSLLWIWLMVVWWSVNVSGGTDRSGWAETNTWNLPRESGLVGTNLMDRIQKYSTVDAGGDLNLCLPLFTIPGKIPVDLNLTYKSGIKLDQKATWVGLGWNLANWSVRRLPVHGDDIHCYDYDGHETRYYVNDQFMVSIPGRTIHFYNDGSQSEPHFVPVSHSLDSLFVYVHQDTAGGDPPGVPDTVSIDHITCRWFYFRYDYFILVDDQATRYVFKFPLKGASVGGVLRDMFMTYGYFYIDSTYLFENKEWLLSAILSHDYVDGGGDPLVPGDGGEDLGSWVKFIYTGDGFNSGTKRQLIMGNWMCQGTPPINAHHDTVEVAYLKEIITPTTRVVFSLRPVEEYQTIRYWRSAPPGSQHDKDLVLVRLKAGGIGKYYEITFNYEGNGLVPLKTGWHRYFNTSGTGCLSSWLHGEPTLRSVTIGTDNRYQGDSYDATEEFAGGYKKRYTFEYDQSLDDPGGYFACHDGQIAHSHYTNWIYGRDRYPYPLLQDPGAYIMSDWELIDPSWVHTESELSHRAWGDRDWFGYFYFSRTTSTWYVPSPWSLTAMTTPEGLRYEYEYDQDEYDMNLNGYSFRWRSGGGRVSRIIENAAPDSIHADGHESHTITLSYGHNGDGVGYPTSLPGNFYSYFMRYSPDEWNCDWDPGELPVPYNFIRFSTDHVAHVIQYPKITWSLSDNMGSIEYFYQVADTSSRRHKLLIMEANEHMALSGQTAHIWYGVWLDRSPLQGIKSVSYTHLTLPTN